MTRQRSQLSRMFNLLYVQPPRILTARKPSPSVSIQAVLSQSLTVSPTSKSLLMKATSEPWRLSMDGRILKHSVSFPGKSMMSMGLSFRFELPHTMCQPQINASYLLNIMLNNIIGALSLKICSVVTQLVSGWLLPMNEGVSTSKCFALKLPSLHSIIFLMSLDMLTMIRNL